MPVEPVNVAQGASSALEELESPRKSGKLWKAALISSSLAGLSLMLSVAFNVRGLRERHGQSAAPQIRSIAVLPLENLSGNPSQEYFSEGMTDALITDLAQMSSLKVISRCAPQKVHTQIKKGASFASDADVNCHLPAAT